MPITLSIPQALPKITMAVSKITIDLLTRTLSTEVPLTILLSVIDQEHLRGYLH